MDRESVERLRFDRRLQRRRGWVEDTDLESHLESLPDVSDKMTTAAELEAEEASEAEKAGAPADSGAAPVAGEFRPVTNLGGGGLGADPGGSGQ